MSKKVSVCIELNDAMALGGLYPLDYIGIKPDELVREFGLRCIEEWRKAGINNFDLITNKWNIPNLYAWLRDKGQTGIRGGVKANHFFSMSANSHGYYDLHSESCWREYTKNLRQIGTLTGDREVILENESLLLPYWAGPPGVGYEIQSLTEAMWPLVKGNITPYIWSPRYLYDSRLQAAGVSQKSRDLTLCMARVPHSRFIVDYQAWGPDGWKWHNRRLLYSKMREEIGQPHIVEILYVNPQGYYTMDAGRAEVYTPKQLKAYLDSRSEGEYIVYPGADALTTAQEWAYA